MSISTLGFGFQGGGSGGGGSQGPAGTDGSVWRNGDGVPSNGLGQNGDYYLQNENGEVFIKVGGSYVPTANIKGADGTDGTNGSVWYTGNGIPAPSPSYKPTDFFLDNNTGEVYQYDGTDWIPQTNIFGTDGTNGSVWYSGAGSTPPVGTYNQYDLYLDTDTNNLYQYDGTNWNQITNIQGANGSQWYTGSGEPTTITNDGDFYLNADDGEVWEIVLGSWQDTGTNIKGANGTSGTDGSVWYTGLVYPPPAGTYLPTDFYLNTTTGDVYQLQNDGITWVFQLSIVGEGIAGSVWYNGDGAPSTLQTDGDYYLNNLNGDVYQQVSGSWGTPIANIKGAQGDAGTDGTNGANSVTWSWNNASGVPEPNNFSSSNVGEPASAQTFFNIYDTNNDGNQSNWLNAAQTFSTDGKVGYLQVTNQENPTQYAVYTINTIEILAGYHTFNVTYSGGNDYSFTQTAGTNFAFSYSFDGLDGSTWFNGNGVPDNGTGIDGDYYLNNLNGDVYQKASGTWGSPVGNIKGVQGDAGQDGVSSSFFFYRANAIDVGGAPTNQKVNWNNATQLDSTELGISTITDDAVDITIFLALLNVGDTIIIQDKNVAANYQTWKVINTITDNTTWFSVPVILVASGGNAPTNEFANNHPVILAISREGAAGIDAANTQRYNYDSNVGGVPQAYSFTANGTEFNDSTIFNFNYYNQAQVYCYEWWNALYQNFLINPNNNFLQIRTIANSDKMGSYRIQDVTDEGTYFSVKISDILADNGALNGAVSVSYSLSGVDGAAGQDGTRGTNGSNSNNWLYANASGEPDPSFFSISNPDENASAQTYFQLSNTNGQSVFNYNWLNAAKTLTDSTKVGYLQVTNQIDPTKYAIYTITAISDGGSSFGFDVTFLGGIDYLFTYPLLTEFAFAYVYNGSGGGTPLTIQEEGTDVDTGTTTINFTGSSVTATQTSAGVVEVAVTGGGTPLTIQEEGTDVDTDTITINFTGAGVLATQTSAGVVEVAIAGGGGGFGGIVSSIRSLSTSTTLSPFVVGTLTMPYDGEITGWTIFSDVLGGCDVRYYVGTFASYPPTTPLFTGLNPNPTLTAEISNDASGLSVMVTKGQVIQCELFAVSGAMTRIDVTLQITKT